MKSRADSIRLKYLYRRMILNGEISVSHSAARRLVGPDCAYHLYGRHTPDAEGKGVRKKGKAPSRTKTRTRK
jgi:hypothetical protein